MRRAAAALASLFASILASFALLAAPAAAQFAPQASDALAPEIASGLQPKPLVSARNWMAAAANPHATAAAADMLRRGGSAVDAAIAAQLVLGLVEPQSSGLGGGAFLVHWDAGEGRLTTLDGRETAPAAATPTLFQTEAGEPLAFMDAVVGGRSVGAPGTPRLLEAAHRRFGKLAWADLFAPAIRLAQQGFDVSPRLAAQIAADAQRLARDPAAAAYFLPGGEPLQQGRRLVNPAYAETLKALRDGGANAFYEGPIAADIVSAVRNAKNPGVLAADDLARYAVVEREAVCGAYRAYQVCGIGPPSSGGIAVAQILGMLEGTDLTALGPDSAKAWRLIGDASRLAFADRERYVADPAFVPQPTKGLLARDYLAERATLLAGERALAEAPAGSPKWSHALRFAPDPAIELPGTSHLSIVDGAGDVVSMTTTIEAGFGSRLMARGFLLNNELTDFSFRSHREGVPVANRVEPGKRPRSSMAPTIVLKDGRPVLSLGSPGGSQIIGYVAKTLIAHLDWGMDVGRAAALPNMLNRNGPFELETGPAADKLAGPLGALGFETRISDMTSGVQAIAISPDGLTGGVDPRREGLAVGE
ncbi:gamma-glutamyltransferase [Chenggangzhangella methanolivorans]|uniref:Glutathione hydrolase proenzyme n=1 Tax=Chenggangzhangella methanolivorans TaxID=1437009 RepID=A0A9E6R706_9HYPH|nr:gamma-glutamyltransferase [Chenggangzhangella methanolivorans]QZN98571.1 gamma-glutamyltransferase [Chenggangzhangella methanolivorans]